MNFLAHIYLSGDDEEIMIGNFIGDFVKGQSWRAFDEQIQKGIRLHRAIDEYTDSHAIVIRSKEKLRPKYRHYSPVIVDVFYDHFLSKLWSHYHETPLLEFTKRFYRMTERYENLIPERARHMLHVMKKDNWLYHYQYVKGIERTLNGMSRRTPYDSHMEMASKNLEQDYESFKEDFESFFPELINYSKAFLSEQ